MSPTIRAAAPSDLSAVLDVLERSQLPSAGLADHVGSTLVTR